MSDDLYRIGATAKLTGITPECLRAWERRYGLTPAERAGKTRFYSKSQVEWLKKIKRLIDQGHPISQLVNLTDADLDERLVVEPIARAGHGRAVGLVGANLLLAEREQNQVRLEIVGRWASLETFDAQRKALPDLDVVVLQVPSLDAQLVETYIDSINARLVVAYRFATLQDLEAAAHLDVALLEWPAPWSEVEQACLAPGALWAPGGQDRRYSDDELVHIASMAARAQCDCPRHIVTLITELNAFAHHTARCGSATADDAPAHDHIASDTRAARAWLELALDNLVERHGLLHTPN
ncbi:MAG: MerR family transcriptional regulator [Gammaproteobacteria bacterium]|nr:MerR family transcriptional regulator [Gammaproteobacteria bacterium]